MEARPDATPLPFTRLFLDPVTGAELGRLNSDALPTNLAQIMPFVYRLHYGLALGETGAWILGLVALIWTVDCFVGFYLTLPSPSPTSKRSYQARWAPAWVIKRGASFYRLNFDLHRAGGLWLWAMLLIFAWSSVYMDLTGFYIRVTSFFLDYEAPIWAQTPSGDAPSDRQPLGWEAAQAAALKLLSEQAREHGLTVDRIIAFNREASLYELRVHSNRDIGGKYGSTSLYLDAYTGAFHSLSLPTGRRAGETLTTWLAELHTANVFGLFYRIFVSFLGLAIVILSGTGVYVWWKKRSARQLHREHRKAAIFNSVNTTRKFMESRSEVPD